VFPTDRWWPRDIVFVDMTRGPPAIRSSGYEGAIAALLLMLAAVCLVCLALVLLKRRMSDGEVVLGAARQLWLRWLNPSAASATMAHKFSGRSWARTLIEATASLLPACLSRRACAPFGLPSFTPRAATRISRKATLADLRSQRESHGPERLRARRAQCDWAPSRIVGRSFACNAS